LSPSKVFIDSSIDSEISHGVLDDGSVHSNYAEKKQLNGAI